MTSRYHFGKKAGMCDECGLEATLKCSGCGDALYCGTMCQKVAWKSHKRECKVLRAAAIAGPTNPLSFGTDERVWVAETDLDNWLLANGHGGAGPGSKHASELIKAYGSNPDIAFSPADASKPFQQALLTLSRLFFIHTVQSLSVPAVEQLGRRLHVIPPYSDTFDGFTGKEVDDPANQSRETYNWLMRTMSNSLYGLADNKAVKRWGTLGEVGVQLWEEQTAVERMLAQAARAEAEGEEEDDEDYDSDEEHGGHKCCGGHHH